MLAALEPSPRTAQPTQRVTRVCAPVALLLQVARNANRSTHAFYARDPNAGEAPAFSGKAFLQDHARSPEGLGGGADAADGVAQVVVAAAAAVATTTTMSAERLLLQSRGLDLRVAGRWERW